MDPIEGTHDVRMLTDLISELTLLDDTFIFEGSLEAKLPTLWRDGNGTARKKVGRGESQMDKVRRQKMQVREKVGKSRNTMFFQCFVAPEGRKVGSLKRRVRR